MPPAKENAQNPIDAFLLAQLRTHGLQPAPPARRHELLRRVTFDLTGLPPTPDELESFENDNRPDAYAAVVDRLLASRACGERWAQHWLDLAHYADSNGFELDADRPDAWRYRDWVIQALNDDLPYDQFLTLQVAGAAVRPGETDALVAAGFCRSGPLEVVGGNIDPEVRRQNELTAATTTTGSVALGLTMGCARCHDHKFDPITAADYYRLEAYFAGSQLAEVPLFSAAEKAGFDRRTTEIQSAIKPLVEARQKLEEPHRKRLEAAKERALTPEERALRAKPREQRTPEENRLVEGIGVALKVTWEEIAETIAHHPADHEARETLKRRIHELEQLLPRPLAHAMTLVDGTNPPPATHILKRGDIRQKLGTVSPAPPTMLTSRLTPSRTPSTGPGIPDHGTASRRLELARWLTSPQNPLTARVIVNRLWQHHFGRGLVGTPSDFGTRGDRPTHPELLDWLAQELVRQDWHLKPIHRLILLSAAYQRSSSPAPTSGAAADPDNHQLWRMNRRRMDAEGLRDSMLAVAGRLNRRAGGPGVRAPLEPEVADLIFTEAEVVDLWPVDSDPWEHTRRSIYLHRKRNVHYPLFDAFDAPDAQTPCPQRAVSTHAPQALVLLNSRFALDTAATFGRSLAESARSPAAAVHEGFLRCFSRPPTPAELDAAVRFLDTPTSTPHDRWSDFALALLNSNEFIHIP